MFKAIEEVTDRFSKLFTWDEIDIDNWHWKLYSKVSAALCMLSAAICICSTYFGNAIDCYGTEDKFITQYCWVHGSYQFAAEQESLVKTLQKRTRQNCVQDDFYDKEAGDIPTTAYYQWVIFMLFGHGCLFMLPDYIWKFAEGGLIKDFVPFEKNEDDKEPLEKQTDEIMEKTNGGSKYKPQYKPKVPTEKGVDMERKAKIFTQLSKSQNKAYFTTFVVCEMLNLGVAVFNFYVMNMFLNGRFLFYGTDVIQYFFHNNNIDDEYGDYSSSSDDYGMVNPMCAAFPTLVNCEYAFSGVNREADIRSHICILSQNIVNEKIYLLMWFWLAFLFGASSLMLLYRCSTILLPYFRTHELFYRARKGNSKIIPEVQRNVSLSEWFILCQIGRNSKSRDFNEFLYHLRPLVKRSWSRHSSKNDTLLQNKNEPLLTHISNEILARNISQA